MNVSDIEHRKRMLDIIQCIPTGIPDGWKKATYAVGGLMYLGFPMCVPRNWWSYHPKNRAL